MDPLHEASEKSDKDTSASLLSVRSHTEEAKSCIKEKRLNLINTTLLGPTIIGVIFCISGIILLCTHTKIEGYEIVEDYTDCTAWRGARYQGKCKDVLNATGTECRCYILIMVTEAMKAPVTVYYELDGYDQIIEKYSESRDDQQLAGHLSVGPSESCGSHTYACTATGRKPIAPCGRLADAMFNDTFTLQTNNTYVLYSRTGLIPEDDKKQFRNPDSTNSSVETLSKAFEKFAKPMNWRKNAWELDTVNPDNNGFQNEAFIIWMNTDLKRKPAWRVKHEGNYEHGLPVANYTLRVSYSYPPSRYDGKRKVIISSVREVVNIIQYGFGVALLVIGLMFSFFSGLHYRYKCKSGISWKASSDI